MLIKQKLKVIWMYILYPYDWIKAEIVIKESNDPRSYRQDSSKLLKTGFKPLYGIDNAIEEIKVAFENNLLKQDDSCYTVKWMKSLNLQNYL